MVARTSPQNLHLLIAFACRDEEGNIYRDRNFNSYGFLVSDRSISNSIQLMTGRMNGGYFKPELCSVMPYRGVGTTWADEISFGMNHVSARCGIDCLTCLPVLQLLPILNNEIFGYDDDPIYVFNTIEYFMCLLLHYYM